MARGQRLSGEATRFLEPLEARREVTHEGRCAGKLITTTGVGPNRSSRWGQIWLSFPTWRRDHPRTAVSGPPQRGSAR